MLDFSKINAIILNYNSSDDTIELYEQLTNLYPSLQIRIIDNHSIKSERDKLNEKIKNINVIFFNSYNNGYAKGNNIGIYKSIDLNFNYAWILNPDIRVEKFTLHKLYDTIISNSKIAAVGPRILYRQDKNRIYSDGGLLDKKTFFTDHINYNQLINNVLAEKSINNVSYVNGSTILINLKTIKEIGSFYEDFFLYYEETEWCNRALDNGWKVLVNTESVAYHTSSKKGKLYKYYMYRNRLLFAKLEGSSYKKIIKKAFIDLTKELKTSSIKCKLPSNDYLIRLKALFAILFYKIK